jgi:deoxyadenosine/deoxycytidine kinase
MKKESGKIIAVVGAPRSGKSYLAKKLSQHFNCRLFLEGEDLDFPARIKEDIKENVRPLERILWFRNQQVKKFFLAVKYRNKGETVIVDTFWFSYQLYIDALTKGFERKIVRELADTDRKSMPWPDKIIFLDVSEKNIRKFIELGGRDFDNSEDFIKQQVIPISDMHRELFNKKSFANKVVKINRSNLDFNKTKDFNFLLKKIF